MKAMLEITMDNAAFEEGAELEVARILQGVAAQLQEEQADNLVLRDINGNTVGHFFITDDPVY